MAKNLTLRRFSNLESATVSDSEQLAAASRDIETVIDYPLLKKRIQREFRSDQIDETMAYEIYLLDRALLVTLYSSSFGSVLLITAVSKIPRNGVS